MVRTLYTLCLVALIGSTAWAATGLKTDRSESGARVGTSIPRNRSTRSSSSLLGWLRSIQMASAGGSAASMRTSRAFFSV